jgi:hypothetical protein
MSEIIVVKDSSKDLSIVRELRRMYRQSRGWLYHFTSLEVVDIQLCNFSRLYPKQDIVTSHDCDLPFDPKDDDFEYDRQLRDNMGAKNFKRFVEAMLIHRYHYCCDPDSERMLQSIPKRKEKLNPEDHSGYGLRANQGLVMWRLGCALVVTVISVIVFAVCFLYYKPAWDLSDATVPFFVACTVIGLVAMLQQALKAA